VSGSIFSMLNVLNPSIGMTGTKQYVSGLLFSILNGISPAPQGTSSNFVNSAMFSISNLAAASHSVLLSGMIANSDISARIAQPWSFRKAGANAANLIDSDGDGIPDEEEIRIGTNPFDADTDHDGYPDGLEIALGSNPLDPNSIPNINRPGFVISPVLFIQNNILNAMKLPVPPVDRRRKQ